MLNPQRLRVFHEVATRGSLAAAARALSFSQSAVSQQISALERELGTSLLDRTSAGVRLTEPGRALSRHATAVLSQLREAEREMRAIGAGEAGEVRIGAFTTAAATLVASAISELRRVEPGIRISLREGDPDHLLPLVASGELDFALDFEYDLVSFDRGEGCERLLLCEEPLLIAMPASHPLSRRRRLDASDLRDQDWIGGTAYACNDVLRHVGARAGFEPTIVFESNDYATVQALIAAGVGFALLPALALANLRSDLVAREVACFTARRRTFIARRAGGFWSAASRRVDKALRDAATDTAAVRGAGTERLRPAGSRGLA